MDARRHKHVKRAMALKKIEQADGQFYVTGLCNIDFEQALDRLQTNTYMKKYAIDVFRYCFFFESDDCKEICNLIIEQFGFGLRNKRSSVRAKGGWVFVYTSPYKKIETKRHIKSAFTKGEGKSQGKRMRSDDRLAMTSMRFHRTSPEQLASLVTNREHYLGSITYIPNEGLMRKRVISMKPMMNKFVDEIFTDCYIAMSDNVRRDMANFFDKVGNVGLRHKRAVSKAAPGGVYLLLKKGIVKQRKEQNNLLEKFAQRVRTEPAKSHSARVTYNTPAPDRRAKKRKREMEITDTSKWVQMKKSKNSSNLSSKTRSLKKPSEQTFAAATAPWEDTRGTRPPTTHDILSEKIKEVLCKNRNKLHCLTPKIVRREVESALGYEKGGLDPKKAWMKTKLEELHKKLLTGEL